ncbi:MAG: HDOD domain-containing protein [Planctomycetes bacterium]|nr:HDOD domain-containing protein [Planctomycetota bacterium]
MKIWNWIVEALTGQDGESSGGPSTAGGSAVATLERPDGTTGSDESNPNSAPVDRWWAPPDVTQVEPISIERPDLPPEARVLENLLVSHFDGHDLAMPPMPRVAERVLAHLRDPKSSMTRIAKDIAEDQVMAADILRMANSALYGGLHRITNLQAAVTRLGGNAIRTFTLHQSLRAAMFQKKGVDINLAEGIWRRSLASGCIMRGLAQFTHMDPEEASLIGLLHDIGNVIVLRIAHEQSIIARRWIDPDTFEYLCFECHQEFGELIADAWKLPDTLRELISSHHAYPDREDPLRVHRLMLMLTDMTNQMLRFDTPADYDLLKALPVEELGLASQPGFEEFLAGLPDQIAETVATFQGS